MNDFRLCKGLKVEEGTILKTFQGGIMDGINYERLWFGARHWAEENAPDMLEVIEGIEDLVLCSDYSAVAFRVAWFRLRASDAGKRYARILRELEVLELRSGEVMMEDYLEKMKDVIKGIAGDMGVGG